ncbi:Sentrin-specific protease 6 [Vanrija pseudolonga]|uniref:Sentrin-specific protease 6 n=1 Tax=Vanrija pseudolonga TaxID=143232 RepID=A0AAF0YB63_9TREE|nr:Sentrin-specific protease 6 [Vanrija pseudolonga]
MEYQATHSQSPPKPSLVNGLELPDPGSSMSTPRPNASRRLLGIEIGAAADREDNERKRKDRKANDRRLSGLSSPYTPGRNTLNGAPSSSGGQRHDRSTHGRELNPAQQRSGGSRQHVHSSPTRGNWSPDEEIGWRPPQGRGQLGQPPDPPPAKRAKVTQQKLDNSFGRTSSSRERVRDLPEGSEILEVPSSEDEGAVKRNPGFPSAPGPSRSHTASRSGSPQKSSPTKKPPGPHRLASLTPDAESAPYPVLDDDDDYEEEEEEKEEEKLESIEQFSSSAETIPPKMKPSATRPVPGASKLHVTIEKRKAPMRKKDGSVQEPAPSTVAKPKKAVPKASQDPFSYFSAKAQRCFSGDRPIRDVYISLKRGYNFFSLYGKPAPETQDVKEEIPLNDIKEVHWCLDPPMMWVTLAAGSGSSQFESLGGGEPTRGMVLQDNTDSRDFLQMLTKMLPADTKAHRLAPSLQENLDYMFEKLDGLDRSDGPSLRNRPNARAGPSGKNTPSQMAYRASEMRRQSLQKVLSRPPVDANGRKPRSGSEEYQAPMTSDRRKGKGRADDHTQTKLDFHTPVATRRSTRAARRLERVDDPSDSDEPLETDPPPRAKTPRIDRNDVLFGWPLQGRSDVQVTKGDKYRLVEGDFLNDTFLDFGLRYTLHEQAITQGTRDKVHMFNSFFYDKLSKKDKGFKATDEEWPAYDSVKKWTKTANIFEKDFIIVPINESLHWFLAVIYNPRGILKKREPQPESEPARPATTRPATRRSAKLGGDNQAIARQSSSRSSHHQPPDSPKPADSDDPLNVIDQSFGENADIEKVSSQVDKMSISRNPTPEIPSPRPIQSFVLEMFHEQDKLFQKQDKSPRRGSEVEPTASSPPKGPAKKPRREDFDIVADDKTYVILLDSLGGTHKAVGNNLKRWLQYEAHDKLPATEVPSLDEMSEAVYIDAKVIEQPNSSDCGVFLIHYVSCLLEDPRSVLQFIGKGPPHRTEVDEPYNAELDVVWKRSATERLRDTWAETLDNLTATWNSLHDIPAPAQGMDESTTSVTALGSCIEPWQAAAHSPALSGDGLQGASQRPAILSPSPPASPSTASRQLATSKPSVPSHLSPDNRSKVSPVPSPTGGISNGETGTSGSSSPLYRPVDLEPQQAPTPRSKRPVVEVELRAPGDFPRPTHPLSSSSTPGPSSRNTESRGGTTPIHHALEVGALPRMIATAETSRKNPRDSAETRGRNTPSVAGSASDKENAEGKENQRQRNAVSPDSTLDSSAGSPQPRDRRDGPKSLGTRIAAASKLQRTDPAPTRMNHSSASSKRTSASTKPSSDGPQPKRRKPTQAQKNDTGMTAARAISIDSDSGGEH